MCAINAHKRQPCQKPDVLSQPEASHTSSAASSAAHLMRTHQPGFFGLEPSTWSNINCCQELSHYMYIFKTEVVHLHCLRSDNHRCIIPVLIVSVCCICRSTAMSQKMRTRMLLIQTWPLRWALQASAAQSSRGLRWHTIIAL